MMKLILTILILNIGILDAQPQHYNQFVDGKWLKWDEKGLSIIDKKLDNSSSMVSAISDDNGNLEFLFNGQLLNKKFEVIESQEKMFPPKYPKENLLHIHENIIIPKPGKKGIYYLIVHNSRGNRDTSTGRTTLLGRMISVYEIDINIGALINKFVLFEKKYNDNSLDPDHDILGHVKNNNLQFSLYIDAERLQTHKILRYKITSLGIEFESSSPDLHGEFSMTAGDLNENFLYNGSESATSYLKLKEWKSIVIAEKINDDTERLGIFSKNNGYFYMIRSYDSLGPIRFEIEQYHLDTVDNSIPSTRTIIYKIPGEYKDDNDFQRLWRGPDSKIYLFDLERNLVAVINDPEKKGKSCNFQDTLIKLNSLRYYPAKFYSEYEDSSKNYYISVEGERVYCSGDTILLKGVFSDSTAAIEWSGPAGFKSKNSQVSILNASIENSGVYWFKATIEGKEILDTIHVKVLPYPEAVIKGAPIICGNSYAELSYDSLPEMRHKWLPSYDSASSIRVTKAGRYGLIAINEKGCSDTSYVDVKQAEVPKPELAVKNQYCEGDTAEISLTKTYAAYKWSSGETTPSIKLTSTSKISIAVTDSNGCTGSKTFDIYFYKKPKIYITGPSSACIGLQVKYIITTTGNKSNYEVSGGKIINESLNELIVEWNTNGNGKIIAAAYNEANCMGHDTLDVTIDKNLKPEIKAEAKVLCNENPVKLSVDEGYSEYRWSNNETTNSITATQEGSYWCYVKSEAGCEGYSDTITLKNVGFKPTISGPSYICSGTLEDLKLDKKYASYLWNNNTSSETLTVSAPGVYWCDVIDSNGCKGRTPDFEVKGYDIKVDLTPNPLQFGDVSINDSKNGIVNLKNNSTNTITVTGISSSVSEFSLDNPKPPFDIEPQATVPIDIIFNPEEEKEYSAEISFNVEPCSNIYKSIAQGKGINDIEVTAYFPDTSAIAGQPFCIPVYAKSSKEITSIYSIKTAIPFDLIDAGAPIINNEALFDFSGNATFTSTETIIGEICGTILLPGRLLNPLMIKEFTLSSPAKTYKDDGSLRVSGVCTDSLRLIDAVKPLTLTINPNPASGEIKLSISSEPDSKIELILYDVRGAAVYTRTITSIGLNELIIGDELPQGVYQAVIRCGWQVKTERIGIVR